MFARVLALAAGAVFLAGFVLGLTPVVADGVQCGAVLRKADTAIFNTACTDALASRKAPVVTLLAVGGVGLSVAAWPTAWAARPWA